MRYSKDSKRCTHPRKRFDPARYLDNVREFIVIWLVIPYEA